MEAWTAIGPFLAAPSAAIKAKYWSCHTDVDEPQPGQHREVSSCNRSDIASLRATRRGDIPLERTTSRKSRMQNESEVGGQIHKTVRKYPLG